MWGSSTSFFHITSAKIHVLKVIGIYQLSRLTFNLGMTDGKLYPVDYPSNCQFAAHWGEFVKFGYKSALGSIDVRFDRSSGDRHLHDFSVQFVDGQTKVILMLSLVAFCAELEFGESELQDADLSKVLNSFVSIRCSYEHTDTQAQQHLRSLRLWSYFFQCFKF